MCIVKNRETQNGAVAESSPETVHAEASREELLFFIAAFRPHRRLAPLAD